MQLPHATRGVASHLAAILVVLVSLGLSPPSVIGESIQVDRVTLLWQDVNGLLPEPKTLETVGVKLRRTGAGLAPAIAGQASIQTDIKAINRMGGLRCTPEAMLALAHAIEGQLAKDGLVGATVIPKSIPVEGGGAIDIYLVAHLPLDDGRPNPDLPGNLQPLVGSNDTAAAPPPTPATSWLVTAARASWQEKDPLLVEAASVLSVAVRLGERDGVFTAPDNGRRVLVESIATFVKRPTARFDESSLETIGMAVAKHLQRQGFVDAAATVLVEDDVLLIELSLHNPTAQAKTTEREPAAATPPPPTEAPGEAPGPAATKPSSPPEAELPTTPAATEPTGSEPTPTEPSPDETAARETVPQEPPPNEPIGDIDGLPYEVNPFRIAYRHVHPDLPPIKTFLTMPVTLGRTDEGWIAPRAGVEIVTTSLEEINAQGGGVFWSSAIATFSSMISRLLIDDDLMGVFAAPDPTQISQAAGSLGADLRPKGDTELTILVFVGRVVEVRTIGQGKRLPEGEGINHAVHKPIATSSPIRSHDESSPTIEEPRADLLRQSQLTNYIHHLNRHPGRQVEASVAAASVPGGVSLDFMVFEPDPLTLYYEIGNTGTPQENGLRQRFGLVHTQFTGNDDVLTIEYVTSNFKTTNAVLGNYQFRVTEDNRVRAGVMATWNKFVSDQFGQDFIDYSGHSWSVGPQMVFNIYQDGPFFLDLVPGVNYQRVKVTNHLLGEDGQAPFILPYAQLQASRQDQSGLFQGMIGLEGSPLSQDVQELTRLGRINPAERWARLNFSASLSTFLEPLLNPVGWADPETPGTSTLAHELSLRFSGQQSFGSRLVPQFQSILGGLYSVRGYQQSVVAGDNSLFGSVEYRFHLPRTFAVEPEPIEFLGSPFRSSPQYVYGRPDWDLIFKAFFDAGYVYQNGDVGFETNNTLLGAGIGLEFLYKSNLRIQLDWGVALHDLSFGLAEAGSSRLYVTGTFLW